MLPSGFSFIYEASLRLSNKANRTVVFAEQFPEWNETIGPVNRQVAVDKARCPRKPFHGRDSVESATARERITPDSTPRSSWK
jgi:hypothetical protein